ncbi:MAG TPA: UDP-N-acetylmuramoyl-L-alanyl-D-glutamate--2,6-diaminopimelate ligase [Stellaceae bacterium]|nr:UDP-N-acetylmuramoyl-L-alanyl-D-glutamate--2,6-diaminopimelate ligase [Stellaceae bacterium]
MADIFSPAETGRFARDVEILDITADSRRVKPGSLFAALPGSAPGSLNDGRRFIGEAIARGAVAVLTDPAVGAGTAPAPAFDIPPGFPVITDTNPRRRLALLAARFHGAQPRVISAVTGTNGKTSTAVFTRQIWSLIGYRAASLGTLGVEGPDLDGFTPDLAGSMTTPDPINLHKLLALLAGNGVDHLALEASSHGLDQYRLDGVRIAAAAFTNLTQDHLDYHGDMAAYLAAKLRLFEAVMPRDGVAVLNADAPHFEAVAKVARAAGQRIIDFGAAAAVLRLADRRITPTGQHLSLEIDGQAIEIELPLIGPFQAMNVLAALGLVLGTGGDKAAAIGALGHLRGVPGRLQHVATLPNGASVFVDFAHTPDGLEQVLSAVRPHTAGRVWAVFGAGGDRDRAKRPLMGAVVARLADRAIITDDNPRSEKPETIRAAIRAACPDAAEIGDRAMAIETAMRALEAGDTLVIAGKGHERGQTIAGATLPFEDAAVARAVASRLTDRDIA